MKHIVRSSALLFAGMFICLGTNAQTDSCDVYLTAGNFLGGHVSHVPKASEHYRLQANTEFYKPYVRVVRGDSTIRVAKNAVYGYRDNTACSFRFCEKETY